MACSASGVVRVIPPRKLRRPVGQLPHNVSVFTFCIGQNPIEGHLYGAAAPTAGKHKAITDEMSVLHNNHLR
jgi:hypothetical protein